MKKLLSVMLAALMLIAVIPLSSAEPAQVKADYPIYTESALQQAFNRYGSHVPIKCDGVWKVEEGRTTDGNYGKYATISSYDGYDDLYATVTLGSYNYHFVHFDYRTNLQNNDNCGGTICYRRADVSDTWKTIVDLTTPSDGWTHQSVEIHTGSTAETYEFMFRFYYDTNCVQSGQHFLDVDNFYVGNAYEVGYTNVGATVNNELYINTTESGWSAKLFRGNLPYGCELKSFNGGKTYALVGTPCAVGTYEFELEYNKGNTSKYASYVFTVLPEKSSDVTTLPSGRVGDRYSVLIESFEMEYADEQHIIAGSVPPGIDRDFGWGTDGTVFDWYLTGTPTTAGIYEFTVSYYDSQTDMSYVQGYSIRVNPAIETSETFNLPNATVNAEYDEEIINILDGETKPFRDTEIIGSLPSGMTIEVETDQNDVAFYHLKGTPKKAGTYTFKIDFFLKGGHFFGRYEFTITVAEASVTPTPSVPPTTPPVSPEKISLDSIKTGAECNIKLEEVPNCDTANTKVTAGELPEGIKLEFVTDETNVSKYTLTGTPTKAGTYTFTVEYVLATSEIFKIAEYTLTVEDTEPEFMLGDVTGDEKINTADAVYILKHAASIIVLDETQLKAGDVNHDSKVNTADAVYILKFAAGMISELK